MHTFTPVAASQPTAAPPVSIDRQRNGFATASLVLGIVALVLAFMPLLNFITFPLALVGLGLAIPGLVKARRAKVGLGRVIAALVLATASLGTATAVNVRTFAAVDSVVAELTTAEADVTVVFGQPTTNDLGWTEVSVQVTNTSATTESPWVTVAAVSPDGSVQYDTTTVPVADLAPGQTAQQTATFDEDLPADARFVVTDVM